MFEDRTYENIMSECLRGAPQGVDTRQNEIFYDAVASACLKIAEFYACLRAALELAALPSAVGEYLDRKGGEHNIARNPATAARYGYIWSGAAGPPAGERFFAGGSYFVLRPGGILEAEAPGSAGNGIRANTAAVPMNTSGLESSRFGALLDPGADAERDESYRKRIGEKISGSAENGNRQHYKTWCESDPGCARARIIPLFAGPNTVMGVLIGVDGLPAGAAVIDRVQKFIDPITLGKAVEFDGKVIPVGDGLGDGAANLGAHFAAVPPSRVDINVSFGAELGSGANAEQIKAEAGASLTEFFRELALNAPEKQNAVVRASAISALLYDLPGLVDYTNLALNGSTANIEITSQQVAALGEVIVSEIV